MKKFILGSVALAMIAGHAMAADMLLKAPPPAPVYGWTGFYVGINGGYSWGHAANTYTIPGEIPVSTSQSMDGWLFGGQAGYNWQMNSNWLLGLEADIQATGQQGTASSAFLCTAACAATVADLTAANQEKLPWFGTVRGRLGFLSTNSWLIYVTGGLAYGGIESNEAMACVVVCGASTVSTTTVHAGWTVGGGVEAPLRDNWTAKLEYLYMDLGTVSNTFPTIVAPAVLVTASTHVTDNVLRVGLNYHFGGPVAAKY